MVVLRLERACDYPLQSRSRRRLLPGRAAGIGHMHLVVEEIECADEQGVAVCVRRIRTLHSKTFPTGTSYWLGPERLSDETGGAVEAARPPAQGGFHRLSDGARLSPTSRG